MNAMDLFSAGSETTATTLAWAVRGMLLTFYLLCPFIKYGLHSITHSQVNYMLLYPEVQSKVQEEVDQVLGDRAPSLADRGRY